MQYSLNVKGARKNIYSGHLKMNGTSPTGDTIDFTNYYMTYNGKPFYSISGEFHFSRYVREKWEEQILKIKACGLDTIATYMFWIFHEFNEGKFNFTGNRDIREFVKLCHKHGMMVILRIGPYSHGECRNGGLPDWLFGRPFEVRSNDNEYLEYVERYYHQIGIQVSDLMFTQGGPIIAIQLENEYMGACSPWEVTVTQNREWTTQGRDGLEHIKELRRLAEKAGLKTAFLTCTGWGNAPYLDGEMLPLWGGYAYCPWIFWDSGSFDHLPTSGYIFRDQHDETVKDGFDKKYPFACCEIGGGMQTWYTYRFTVEPESVEAMSLVTVAGGCNFLGYYMFHGGRNPVIDNVYTNEQLCPRISYDFQAPLGDFGQPKESYKRIKLIHYFLKDFNDEICLSKPVIPEGGDKIEPVDLETLRYAARSNGESGFIFINNFQDHLQQKDKTDIQLLVETDHETLLIPRYNKMCIGQNVAAVLPFHADLSGLRLEYSTAQYITGIESNGCITYFFFTHEGLDGEMCFDGNAAVSNLCNAQMEIIEGKLYVYVGNSGYSSFTVASPAGKAVNFFCMDRQQSLDFWKVTVKGQDYAVIAPANVYSSDNSIHFEVIGLDHYEILTWPELPHTAVDTGEMASCGSCMTMHKYKMTNCMPSPSLEVEQRADNKAIVKFNPNLLEELSELYLHVDYIGDIGWAFINGKLVHDDISNGTTWKIGLKAFEKELKDHSMYLYISPQMDGNHAVKMESTSTYVQVNVSEDKKACFAHIRLIPEKTQTLFLG